jgi:type IV secretion system protein TrbL
MSCGAVGTVVTGGLCPVVSSVGSSVASSVAGNFMATIANAFATAADKSIQFLVTGWTEIPTPSVSGGATSWLQGQLQPLVVFVGAIAIVAAMVRMVWANRAEPAKEMLAGLLRLVVVSGAGLAGIDILLKIGDAFSSSILNAATPNGGNFGHLVVLSAAAVPEQGLLLILAAIAILASLIQIFLLIARGGLIVVLGGTWPLAAAASSTPAGNAWFRKTTAWLLAFVLFKPTAAIVYAAALRLTLSNTSNELATLEGVMLFAMAILALPALMRFAVPAVAAVGGISAGKVAAGAAVLATGAIAAGGAMGAMSAGGGAGAASGAASGSGPTGAAPSGGTPPGGSAPSGASGGTPGPAGASSNGSGGASPNTTAPVPTATASGAPTQPMGAVAGVQAAGVAVHAASNGVHKATGEEQS